MDGTCVGDGVGADIIAGDPLQALVWLANSEVAIAMGGLQRGWVVSLGSVCQTHWVEPAARTKVHIKFSAAGLGTHGVLGDIGPACGGLQLVLLNDDDNGRVACQARL